MPVFNHMPMGEDGLREVYSWVDSYVKNNQDIADKISLGTSGDAKWDIPAVIVTNKSISGDEKQNAVITLARHGQERGARVIGPEILDWLAGEDAREIRDKQTVIVVPVANPEGFILDEFHSSMHGITDLEKRVWGNLCSLYTPDMMMDYHSLGKVEGARYDRGDMEVILPANTTRWGMDEQIYRQVANRMAEEAAAKGWPYEVHTLEDLNTYYFGDTSGRFPQAYLQEKVFLLHIQNLAEHYDFPGEMTGYTNYTCGPAYSRWHTLIFGIETNHWAIGIKDGLAESGLAVCQSLLNMGNTRFPWEKDAGYPTNLIVGDFRISIRATGKNPGERRISRKKLWNEKANFNILKREMGDDSMVTLAEVGYIGENVPLDFNLCLRMRQDVIKQVMIENHEAAFETFTDDCSTYLSIPVTIDKPGLLKLTVRHEAFNRQD
ncbi:MAG: hypothetical protein JW712_01420 [Dehalococcoidales bacterium]|nr:hypothetical protein [Dehalococcoidales bacterium]